MGILRFGKRSRDYLEDAGHATRLEGSVDTVDDGASRHQGFYRVADRR